MRLRTIIADDEPDARAWIRWQLERDDEIELVAECDDGRKALQAIESFKPDLLFLNVQMPRLDGFGVLRALKDGSPPAVIFLAAHDQHALRAFEIRATDYLLKPLSEERFGKAVASGKKVLREAAQSSGDLLELLRDFRRYPEWLLTRADGRSQFVRVRDVDWIDCNRDHSTLHVGSAAYIHHDTASGVESKLDPARFLRIHRSTIVNIERIKELLPWFNGDYAVTLKNGVRLTMSGSHRRQLGAFRRGAI